MSINKQMIKLIKKYQQNKPPGTPARCKHYPTCSNYGIECFEKFNFFKAGWLTFKRILFCTPLNKNYFDPVPLTKDEKKESERLDFIEEEKISSELIDLSIKYPLMELDDYLKVIYQNTFGPNHLLNDQFNEYLKQDINNSPKEEISIDEIGDNYIRINLYQNIDFQKVYDAFSKTIENNKINNNTYIKFYHRINVLIKLINNKKINLKIEKKELSNKINQYLISDLSIHHSNTYNNNYHPHYLVVRKEYYK